MNPFQKKLASVLVVGGSFTVAHPCVAVDPDPACRAEGGAYVCVQRTTGTPVEDTHFSLDFSDPDNPSVEFITGAQDWRVWSQVSAEDDTPANLGALNVDADNTGKTFKVKVWN